MCQWIINMWVSGGQKCKFFGKFCVGAKYINLINTGDIDFFFLQKDPAIERWNTIRETTTPHFKWTPKTVAMAIFWLGVVPGSLYKIVKDDVVGYVFAFL